MVFPVMIILATFPIDMIFDKMISFLLADSQGRVTSYTPHDLLSVSMDQKVIISMMLPASTPQDYILSYKVRPRKQVRLEMNECIINHCGADYFRKYIHKWGDSPMIIGESLHATLDYIPSVGFNTLICKYIAGPTTLVSVMC